MGSLFVLIGVPIVPVVAFVIVLLVRPTWYWRLCVLFVACFQVPAVFLGLSLLFDDASGPMGLAFVASLAAAPLVLMFLFENAVDMQSAARARLYSAPQDVEALETRPEKPTRYYPISPKRSGRWDNFTVPMGLPRKAFFIRHSSHLLLSIANLALGAIWVLMVVFTRSLIAWTVFGLVAAAPLVLALRGRRVGIAAVHSLTDGVAVVQVVDAIRPEFLRVDLSNGVVVRNDSDTAWVAVTSWAPERSGARLLLVAAPKSWSRSAAAQELLDEVAWRRALWLGSRWESPRLTSAST